MAANPTIRPAGPGDVDAIAEIHATSWQATYRGMMPDAYLDGLTPAARRPMWEQILSSPPPRVDVRVIERDGEVAGFVWTGPCLGNEHPGTTGELYAIYLRPGLEGQGLGRQLLAEGESAIASRGFTNAILHVARDNHRARRFYEAAGWATNGEERREDVQGTPVIELTYRCRLHGKVGSP